MKKFILSLFTIVAFAGFGLYRWLGLSNGEVISVNPAPTPMPLLPTPSPTAVPVGIVSPTPTKPTGQYRDGRYTGTVADAYYGNVQVQALIQNGRLADVTFLQYPNDRSTSRLINGQATALLAQEAIQAQSANVDVVSGATDTTGAFRESLGSALAQAH